jgi:hypothetical protein
VWIASPFDQVLVAALASLMVQYHFDLILLFTIDDIRQWPVTVNSCRVKVGVE